MKKFIYTCLAALIIFPLYAQEEENQSFSLDEAIAYALEYSYTSINSNREILDAQKQKWEVIATGLPQIDGNINYQNRLKQPVTPLPAEVVGGDPGTFIPVVFTPPQAASATATLRQQIFDGSYIVGIQATNAFLRFSQNNKEKTDQEVTRMVVEAYGNVLLAQETANIAAKNKETLEKNLYETEKLYENGLGDEESVEQLKITLASIDNVLKNAIRFENITMQMLNLVMGLPVENNTQLEENLDDLVLNLNEQRYYELKLAKSKALPRLNAFVNYGTSSFSDQFDFLGTGGPEWFQASTVGVDLDIPIFSSLNRSASTQRAKIALEQAKTELTETEQRLELELERAKSDYLFAIETYQTNKDNLDLAERIEQKNQTKYAEGLATSFELRQAQTQLYTAQGDYLQSMVDVINRKTNLETILNN